MITRLSRRTLLKQAGIAGVGLALAGCAGTPAPAATASTGAGEAATAVPAATKKQVSLMYYTSTTPAIARMEKQEAGFKEKYPDIELTIIQEPSDPDGKLKVMYAAGTEPNVFWAGLAANGFAAQGVFAPLDDLIKGDASFDLTTYYERVVDGFIYDGKLYALPYGFTTSVWFYNKALFDAKGVPYPTDDWKLEDFHSIASALTEGDQYGVGDLWVYIGNFMAGGRAWDNSFTQSAINTPETIWALQWNYDLRVTAGAVPPADVLQEQGAIAMFQNQKAAMITLGRWGLPVAVAIEDFDWDIAAFPTPPQGKRGTWTSFEGFSITSRTQDMDSAWKLVKYLCDEEAQRSFYVKEGSAIPAIRAVAESDDFSSPAPGKNHAAYLKSIDFAVPVGKHPADLRLLVEPWEGWQQVLDGKITVEEFAAQAAEIMNTIIAEVAEL
ncbi:MAG: sugar ABC transporter substrate-binding protein [Anaerolineae bacterium]|nr:sugar ABC transporter substrate-binding protein [Anaerolineae bacterium]